MRELALSTDVEDLIGFVRGRRVMFSSDLARLYEVSPKVLIQAVKRNRTRFPEDFLFQLTSDEFRSLKSHFVTSKLEGRGGIRRATPYAFTEQGVAMLSSVLRSPKAIRVNIAIMRAFVRLRGALSIHRTVLRKLIDLERKVHGHDDQLAVLAEAIRELEALPDEPPKEMGFRP